MSSITAPRSRVLAAAALSLAVALGASACNSSSKKSDAGASDSPAASASASASAPAAAFAVPTTDAQAVTLSKAAMATMKSTPQLHLVEKVTGGKDAMSMDVRIGSDGSCSGTMDVGSGLSYQVLHSASGTWIKPTDAMWKTLGQTTALSGRWFKASASDSDSLLAGCDTSEMFSASGAETNTADGSTVYQGQKVAQLKDKKDGSLQLITLGASPELVKLSHGTNALMTLTYSDTPLTVTPPPASQVVADTFNI